MLHIKEWQEEDRPREKFEAKGATALTNAELLAILIGSGNSEENAVDLMHRILTDCKGSLRTLGQRTISQLGQYKGVGPAKAITILAACELGKRRLQEEAKAKEKVTSGRDVSDYFASMHELQHEECRVLLLDHGHGILGDVLISKGGMASASIDLRILLREVLLAHATSFILCHNHPSGNLTPSREDDQMTRRVKEAARMMDLRLLDHVIVSHGKYYSYNDKDRL